MPKRHEPGVLGGPSEGHTYGRNLAVIGNNAEVGHHAQHHRQKENELNVLWTPQQLAAQTLPSDWLNTKSERIPNGSANLGEHC
eukprot:11200137-Lingulodinium_polyedra.AAC.1